MGKESLQINLAGIKLSKKSATPLYTQLYEQFRAMILSNRLRPGDRLPASRNLAKELGVSRVIISQGYEQLMMEGYLIGKTGSGTFVNDTLPDNLLNAEKIDSVKSKIETNQNSISTNKNIPLLFDASGLSAFQIGTPSLDFFPYKTWNNVGAKILKELKGFNLGYGDTLGYLPLRKAIASYLRVSRAVSCETEQVIVVTGSQLGLNLIVECLLKKGDKVWMEDPGYHGAVAAFSNAGTAICPVPVEEDGLNIKYAIRKFSDARLAYVTPSHQFPLGSTLSHAKRLQLLAWAKQNQMWVLEDDYDSEFRYKGNPLASLQGMDAAGVVIYSGTFSKVLFPGLRLAYLVLPSIDMVNKFRQIKINIDRQSPIMEQLILSRFMEEGYFLRHIRKMRLLYDERQTILIKLMHEYLGDYFRLNISASGMHLICWLSDKINTIKFQQEIKKEKLVVSFVSDFTISNRMPTAIALGYTAFSKYKLKTGVERLVRCVQNSLA